MMTKIKKWLIALLFGSAVLAAPLVIPNYSFEKLDNVQKISDRYEINFGEGSRVVVGGDGVDFKPHAKLGKWDDEVEINVWLETDKKIKPKQDKGKLKWKDEKKEIHFYTIDDDKFEFEMILNEKPASNIVELKIDSRGLVFYYQPALDIEMAGRDCWTDACTTTDCCDSHRPENVVGSYAVYHESKKDHIIGQTNYMTGKAFHIYRPEIIDSAGIKVWGELNITDNLLTVEIPQEFLDNAVYPVRHAAGLTFGYTTVGGSWESEPDDYFHGYRPHAPASSGDLDDINIYTGWAESQKLRGAVYKDSDDSRIDQSAELGYTGSGWRTMNLTGGGVVNGTDYILTIWYDINMSLAYDSVAGFYHAYEGLTYHSTNDFPNPISWAGKTGDSGKKISIYCTYTAGGAERRIITIE